MAACRSHHPKGDIPFPAQTGCQLVLEFVIDWFLEAFRTFWSEPRPELCALIGKVRILEAALGRT